MQRIARDCKGLLGIGRYSNDYKILLGIDKDSHGSGWLELFGIARYCGITWDSKERSSKTRAHHLGVQRSSRLVPVLRALSVQCATGKECVERYYRSWLLQA